MRHARWLWVLVAAACDGGGGGGGADAGVDPEEPLDGVSGYVDPGAAVSDSPDPPSLEVIDVSDEMFEALMALENGASLASVAKLAGGQELYEALAGRALPAGSPNAYCNNLRAPLSGACFPLDAAMFDAGSYDVDPTTGVPIEGAPLGRSLDRTEVCGLGSHTVRLTVADEEGNSSWCGGRIVLCDAGDPSCPPAPLDETPPLTVQCGGSVRCTWVRSQTASPGDDSTVRDDATGHVTNGYGPFHSVGNFDPKRDDFDPETHEHHFVLRNCLDDDVVEAGPTQTGRASVNLGVICVDEQLNRCQNECASTAEIQSTYRSRVYIQTIVGLYCPPPFWANNSNAFAQDEVNFQVDGVSVFTKGVVVANGTQNTYGSSFELGAGAEQTHEGWSRDVSVTFGTSVDSRSETGPLDDEINAFGTADAEVPVTAVLDSKGKTNIHLEDRVHGEAYSETRHWGMWWGGTSTCPGAGTEGGGTIYGPPSQARQEDKQMANDFFRTRGLGVAFEDSP